MTGPEQPRCPTCGQPRDAYRPTRCTCGHQMALHVPNRRDERTYCQWPYCGCNAYQPEGIAA